jgi:DNA polymerase-3 subunit delta
VKPGAGDAAAFCRAPDQELAGALLHGADEGLVAMRRRELVAALLGPEADPLQLTRLEASALRRDSAALDDAMRSRGFFAGRGVVSLEGATDALAPTLAGILADAAPQDAFLVVSAGVLKGSSELRRLFRTARRLIELEVPAEAPGADEIEARLVELGLRCGLEQDARHLLAGFGASLDRVSFDRLLECVAIFSLDAPAPLRAEDVRLLSPAGLEAEIDAFVDAVAGGRPEQVGPTLRRVVAAGASAVTLLLGLQRHFRGMMMAATGGAGRGPVWGARRDIAAAQARGWRPGRLEQAARMLYDADARVRSAERAPALALVERCALRLALMAGP